MTEFDQNITKPKLENSASHNYEAIQSWLRRDFKTAQNELDHALQNDPTNSISLFWQGMVWASTGKTDEEVEGAVRKALEEGLPPVLMGPLAEERPALFAKLRAEYPPPTVLPEA